VEKALFPRRHIGESLTGGLVPLLQTLGLQSEVDAVGFLSSDWASVHWAGEHRRVRLDRGGLQVDRAGFDEVLLRAARAMPNVRLYQPSRILERTYENGCWRIQLDTGESLSSNYLADAAGRARLLGGKKRPIGTPTLALYAYWKGVTTCEDGDTLVEAGPSAWFWGAPLPGGEFNATVFVDRDRTCEAGQYVELLKQSSLIWPRVRNAALVTTVRICDATPFADETPVTHRYVNTGDAALSIDPLSSQGVQTAIGISLHAAVVLNTMLDKSGDADLAMEFYRSRLKDSACFHSAASTRFYRDQYASCGSEFWRKRAQVAIEEPQGRAGSILGFDTLVSVAPSVGCTSVATVKESRVVAEDGVKFNSRTFAYVGNSRAVAALLRDIDGPTAAILVLQRWSRKMPCEEALQILNWAWVEGLIQGNP
jgi:2-polyprenyl-6-methoxyphenol hydroxylase-like FAD-dependent oxidoreductase